jgi:hypothetical protein
VPASPGDDKTGKTTTLCVRRATYWCPELKADDPAKKGVCSNYLCDSKPGDEVKVTGPSGAPPPPAGKALSLSLSLSLSPPTSLAVGSGSGLELLLLKVGS